MELIDKANISTAQSRAVSVAQLNAINAVKHNRSGIRALEEACNVEK